MEKELKAFRKLIVGQGVGSWLSALLPKNIHRKQYPQDTLNPHKPQIPHKHQELLLWQL